MEARKKKAPARGAILGMCPRCQGTGETPRKLPFLANPKAPATRADKLGFETCPNCNGSGRVGVE